MKLFSKFRASREAKKERIAHIDKIIDANKYGDAQLTVEELSTLLTERRKIQTNGVDAGDIFKGIVNVTVVAVMIGFEMSHIMNQKGSRFVKVL